jgi:hypothetical protein
MRVIMPAVADCAVTKADIHVSAALGQQAGTRLKTDIPQIVRGRPQQHPGRKRRASEAHIRDMPHEAPVGSNTSARFSGCDCFAEGS